MEARADTPDSAASPAEPVKAGTAAKATSGTRADSAASLTLAAPASQAAPPTPAAGAATAPRTEPAPAAAGESAPAAPTTPWSQPPAMTLRPAKRGADPKKVRILPVVFPESDNARAAVGRVGYIIESAIRRASDYEWVDATAKLDPAGAQERTEAAERGNDALVFGRRQYDDLENGLGLESFDRALASFQESALWQNIRGYEHAATMRIVVKWAEDPASAKKDLASLLTLNPKVEFPRDLPLPNDLAQEILHEREAIGTSARTSLDIGTEPAPARVYVDGVFRGTTPTSVEGLIPGDHFLSLVSPGYEVTQHVVHVAPGATLTETLKPTEKGRTYAGLVERLRRSFNPPLPSEVTAAQALGQLAGADEVLAVSVARHDGKLDIEMHRFQLVDGHAAAVTWKEKMPESDQAVAQVITTMTRENLSKDLPHCGGGPCPVPPHGGKVDIRGAQIGMGVTSLALLATGISLAVVAKVQSNAFNKDPQTDPMLKAKGSRLFDIALASDLCNGLGLVSGAIWAYVAFGIPYSQRSDLGTGSMEQTREPLPAPKEDTKPEKKPDKDDPFETLAPTRPPVPPVSLMAMPTPGGFAFSLGGTF